MPDPSNLPQAQVLGYFSNLSTPTHVRIVAARAVFWIAILHFAAAALILFLTILPLWRYPLARWNSWRVVVNALEHQTSPPIVVLFITAATAALVLILVAIPIRKGRKVAAFLALFYLVPFLALITLITPAYAAYLLEFGLGLHGKSTPDLLYRLPILPIAIPIILLLKDLCACLRWIARQPTAEKPPVPFLPPIHHS
jgi:hypothetical protein